MDEMNHYAPTRKQVALRFFVYGVMTLAVLVLSAIGILSVLGYQLNFHNGQLTQGALLQLRSSTSGATVTIDSQTLSQKTSTRSNVTAGSHTVKMTLAGYQPWEKTVDVQAGTVLWLTYTRLIPSNMTTTGVKEYSTIDSSLPSPDDQWTALLQNPALPSFTLADLRSPEKPVLTDYAIPANAYTKAADGSDGTFTFSAWDNGSRYLLIAHTYDATTEYLRFDRENPTDVRNITTQLSAGAVSKLVFADNSGEIFYAQIGSDVRKLNIAAGTISQPLISNVLDMSYDQGTSTIAYTSHDKNKYDAGFYTESGGAVVVRDFDTLPTHFADRFSQYYGLKYLAVTGNNGVELIQAPGASGEKSVETFPVTNGPDYFYFNPEGRFLVAQTGNSFSTYDLETNGLTSASLGTTVTTSFRWIDDFHLVTSDDGTLHMSEFDGTNKVDLGTVKTGSFSSISNNGEELFTIGTNTTDGAQVLDSTNLVVKQ